jgi:hypothetical protein
MATLKEDEPVDADGLPVPRRRLTPAERAAWRATHPAPVQELVHHWNAIPAFADEDTERAWWRTHRLAPELLEQMQPVPEAGDADLPLPARPRTAGQPLSLRLEADTVRRLRALAAKKGTKYQTLLKQFVVERLYEEEKREGLVAPPSSAPAPSAAPAGAE